MYGLIIFLIIIFVRVVPANTIVIIDRKGHYLKTKRFGVYFINPLTDKITTQISTEKLTKTYSNFFETHDGKIVQASFQATYHAKDLDAVIDGLASARRSIDDVIVSSVYWAVNNLMSDDILNNYRYLHSDANTKLMSEAQELNITIDKFTISQPIFVSQSVKPFKPHLSSYSSDPIKYN